MGSDHWVNDRDVPELARKRIDHQVTEILTRSPDMVALARSSDQSIELSLSVGPHALRLSIHSATGRWQASGPAALEILGLPEAAPCSP